MTQTELKDTDLEELKRYLYAELNEEEVADLEERFFLDDEFFFEAMDLENTLVDLYVQKKLSDEEVLRFEKSLEKFPKIKLKIYNSKALQTYITEEKQDEKSDVPVAVNAESQSFWQKLSDFFTIKSPLLGSAMAGLLVIFMIGAILLILDSRRKGEELARLQNERAGLENVWQKREDELQGQISNASQRINELNNQISNRDEDRDELIKSLGTEQQRIQQLESDLEKLRQERDVKPPPTQRPSVPTIASILLTPTLGTRGGNDGKVKTASLANETKKLAVSLALPDDVKGDEKFSILLNEQPYLQNVSPNKKSISLTIPTKNLAEGPNKLTVVNAEGREVTKYIFNVDKQ